MMCEMWVIFVESCVLLLFVVMVKSCICNNDNRIIICSFFNVEKWFVYILFIRVWWWMKFVGSCEVWEVLI